MVTQAPEIEWSAPWWAPVRPLGEIALSRWREGASVADALNAADISHAAPVRFVPQQSLPDALAYEQFIFDRRAVPTRDNLHDFLNGLIWSRYPKTKLRLNELQAAEIARDGVRATRGPVRDAITLFDESGVLLAAPNPLVAALRERRWLDLFGTLRPLWGEARLWVIGHAALEKLVSPYKSITAHVLAADQDLETAEQADAWLADWLSPESLAPKAMLNKSPRWGAPWVGMGWEVKTAAIPGGIARSFNEADRPSPGMRHTRGLVQHCLKPFMPLPLLGVPGWWAENEGAGFYEDVEVFRPENFIRKRQRVPAEGTEPLKFVPIHPR